MGGIKNINIDDKPREGRIIYVAMDDWGCAEVFDTVEEAENFKRAIDSIDPNIHTEIFTAKILGKV